MQRYPVRVSHRANLQPEALERIARSAFDEATRDGERIRARYGALVSLTVEASGKELAVEVVMNPKVPNDVAAETVRRYNLFLEESTGYSAKERAKRVRKSAGG